MGDEEQEASQYIRIGELDFEPSTPLPVAKLLCGYCNEPVRVRIDYGDIETGKSWSIEDAVEGYVRSAGGDCNYPLLLPTTRSNAGCAISSHQIVALWNTDGQRVYKHELYTPKFDWVNARYVRSDESYLSESPWQVLALPWELRGVDGIKEENPASFATEGQAIRWLNKKRKFELP